MSERQETLLIASVRFRPTGKLYNFDASTCDDLRTGDYVLVETVRGRQLGEVVALRWMSPQEQPGRLKAIQRRATGVDLALHRELRGKEQEALRLARRMADRMRLPIKVLSAEYTFDRQRLTLLYTGEDKKLDLSRLGQQMQRQLNVRVDLRRVGPRDYAKLLGGYGACGEPRCCSRFFSEFSPVSIKMAKVQGVSLNPSDITGMCGRLRCCLAYEHEQYKEASRALPRRKKRVRTPHGEGKVVDLLPLRGVVVVQIEDRRVEVPAEEVELVTA